MAGGNYSQKLLFTVLIVSLVIIGIFGVVMDHEIGTVAERCAIFFILCGVFGCPLLLLGQHLETVRNSSFMRGPHGPFLQTLNVFVGAVVTCLLNSIQKPNLILFVSGLVALVSLNELARPTIDFGLINSVFSSATGHFGLFTHTLPSILGSLVCCCILYIRFRRQAAWPKVSVDSTQQQQQSSQSTGPSQHPTAGEEVDELTTAADFPATSSSGVNVQQLISEFNRKFDRP